MERLKRDSIFIHKHWMDENHKPLLCRVTRTVGDTVYWRDVTGGHVYRFEQQEAERWVMGVIKQ
jgi:hypothetical protein